jgi:hypothetical protein
MVDVKLIVPVVRCLSPSYPITSSRSPSIDFAFCLMISLLPETVFIMSYVSYYLAAETQIKPVVRQDSGIFILLLDFLQPCDTSR